jgi:chitooligosaccharide deacetylase
MVLVLIIVGAGIAALTHTAPFPFLLELLNPGESAWHMPRLVDTPAVYLTYDDGPNPTATPALLDVLGREGARATFFVIPAHVTPETAPILRRIVADGHGLALHSDTRARMLDRPDALAERVSTEAARLAELANAPLCPFFRPHAGWRGGWMYEGLKRAGFRLAGWSFGMWDWNWWRRPNPERLAERLASNAADGDVIVLHDGHHIDPRADRHRTVEATARLIPLLRARGFALRQMCEETVPVMPREVAIGAAPAAP